MKQFKTIIWSFITFCLIGCQSQPEALFENIYIGDTLESCLANGTVQHNPDYNIETLAPNFKNQFELSNSSLANSNFSYTGVWFDNNHIVKSIELSFHQKETGKTAKEVFNFMTQYFCQHYHGMRTDTVNEQWETDSYELKYEKEGVRNIWETDKLIITLLSYDNIRIDKSYAYNGNNWSLYDSVREDVARLYFDGNWVELKIEVK